MIERWKIFKGRPHWRATLPDRPWTVLRPIVDQGDGCRWAAHSHHGTWPEALRAVERAIKS